MPGLLDIPSVCALRGRTDPLNGRIVGDESGQAPEILRDGREHEFVVGTVQTA